MACMRDQRKARKMSRHCLSGSFDLSAAVRAAEITNDLVNHAQECADKSDHDGWSETAFQAFDNADILANAVLIYNKAFELLSHPRGECGDCQTFAQCEPHGRLCEDASYHRVCLLRAAEIVGGEQS